MVLQVRPRRLERQVPNVQLASGEVAAAAATTAPGAAVGLVTPRPPAPPLARVLLLSVLADEDRPSAEGSVA